MKATRAAAFFSLLAVLALATGSGAQPAAARAKAQFEQGQAAVQKGDLQRGRELFLSSKALYPAAGTLLNLGDCEEKLGLKPEALQHFQEALALLKPGDDRIAFANQKIASLRASLKEQPAAPAGPSAAATSAAATQTPAPSAGPNASAGPSTNASAGPPVEPGTATRDLGIAMGAVGLAGIVMGAVTGGLALQKKDELEKVCPDPAHCNAQGLQIARGGKELGTFASVGLGAGAPLAVIGGILLLVSRRHAAPGNGSLPPVEASVGVAPGAATLTIRGSF